MIPACNINDNRIRLRTWATVVEMFAVTVKRDGVSHILDADLAVKVGHCVAFNNVKLVVDSETGCYVGALATVDAGGTVKGDLDVKLEVHLV